MVSYGRIDDEDALPRSDGQPTTACSSDLDLRRAKIKPDGSFEVKNVPPGLGRQMSGAPAMNESIGRS